MEALFTTVTTVITKILELFTTVSAELMTNELFQLTIGIVVLGIIMGMVFTMLRKLRRKGR